jgi:hypothetical protein
MKNSATAKKKKNPPSPSQKYVPTVAERAVSELAEKNARNFVQEGEDML